MKRLVTPSYTDALTFAFNNLIKHIGTFVLLGLFWALLWPFVRKVTPALEQLNIYSETQEAVHYVAPWIVPLVFWVPVYIIMMYFWYQLVSLGLGLYKGDEISIRYAFSRSFTTFIRALGARTLMWLKTTFIYIIFSTQLLGAPYLARVLILWFKMEVFNLLYTVISLVIFVVGKSVPIALGFLALVLLGSYFYTRYYFAGYALIDSPHHTILKDGEHNRLITRGHQGRLALITILQIVTSLLVASILSHFMLQPYYYSPRVLARLFEYFFHVTMYTLVLPGCILFNVHIYKQLSTAVKNT